MRYNDKSPLENMHCATLFELSSKDATDVWKGMDNDHYKKARQVCVATILHTDMALHFEMTKDIGKAVELSSEIIERQAEDPENFLPEYEQDVLKANLILWLEMLLHTADVSGPTKPWDASKAWSIRIMDEFFAQGDEEKRLGIPVGMLNDRDSVKMAGSQHGFIVFLVFPLIKGVLQTFPLLQPLGDQLATNLGLWRDLWRQECSPSPEDAAKRDAEVNKIVEQVEAQADLCKTNLWG